MKKHKYVAAIRFESFIEDTEQLAKIIRETVGAEVLSVEVLAVEPDDDGPAMVTDGSQQAPRSTDEPFAQPLRRNEYGEPTNIPETPNTPEVCELQCHDCTGVDHHWLTDIDHSYASEEPEHPAAISGLMVWDHCKHCPAWQPIPDDLDTSIRCEAPRCKRIPDVHADTGLAVGQNGQAYLCRWHAMMIGRQLLEQKAIVMAFSVLQANAEVYLRRKISLRMFEIPRAMILHCPQCEAQHVDTGDWVLIPHRTHRCAHCKHEWRPSEDCTIGVSTPPNQTRFTFEVDESLVKPVAEIRLTPGGMTKSDIAQPIVDAIDRSHKRLSELTRVNAEGHEFKIIRGGKDDGHDDR